MTATTAGRAGPGDADGHGHAAAPTPTRTRDHTTPATRTRPDQGPGAAVAARPGGRGRSSAASASSSPSSSPSSSSAGRSRWLQHGAGRGQDAQARRGHAAGVRPRGPRRAGHDLDWNGAELAVPPHPALTIAATPYLVKDPARDARWLARALGRPRTTSCASSRGATPASPTSRRRVLLAPRAQGAGARDRGPRVLPGVRRALPAHVDGLAAAGQRRPRGPRPGGPRVHARPRPAGRDGERRLAKDASASRSSCVIRPGHSPACRVRLTLDANIQDQAERVLAEVGQEWQPKGATAIVMDPRTGALLALANWPQVNANKLHEAPDYARQNRAIGRQLRARLDVQGDHRRGRARGRQGDARHGVHLAADDPRRRPRDRRGAPAAGSR